MDFARGLGIRRERALEILLRGAARPVDAGRVSYRDAAERRRHFANIADFGLGRATALAIERGPKALGGPLAYGYGALASIARYRPTPIRVEIDGRAAYDGPAALVGVANGPYFGGGMHAAPNARHGDGEFEVLVVEGIGRRQLALDVLPKVYRGAHVDHPALHFFRGQSVTIDADGSFPLEADGEGLGDVPARVELLPRALSILAPAG
jgi:diacylglycerol kinase (ATP)